MYELPGEFRNFLAFEQQPQFNEDLGLDFKKEFVHLSMVDESYQLVGSHLDQNMQDRIIQGEYVDFSRLIPKDKILTADDNRYEMVVKDGKTYWVPVGNQEGTSISNFNRWEQAFCVYSDVYMRAYPHRSSELVQYCHLIHTASQSYTWENVYMYDKDFRLHMARHPTCSWSIILQQAWVVRLKDRLKMNWSGSGNRPSDKKEICKRFNRGECAAGNECRYEHQCSFCFKFGHGVINCRNLQARRKVTYDRYDRYDRDRYDRNDRERVERQFDKYNHHHQNDTLGKHHRQNHDKKAKKE